MKLNQGSGVSAGVSQGYLSPSLGLHCLGISFSFFCNLQPCNEHFKTQQTLSAPPGLLTRPLALSELCRGNSHLPALGLSSLQKFKHVTLQTQLVQQHSVTAVGEWGWGADPSGKRGHNCLQRCWLWGRAAGQGPGICSALVGTGGVGGCECCVCVSLWVGKRGGRTEVEWDYTLLKTHYPYAQ